MAETRDQRSMEIRLRELAKAFRLLTGDDGKLFDDAANRIGSLEYENEKLRVAVGKVSDIVKDARP